MTHNINDVKTIQKLCQTSDFYNVKGKAEIGEKNIANLGKIWQRKVRKNYAKSFIHLPWQYTYVAVSICVECLILLGFSRVRGK